MRFLFFQGVSRRAGRVGVGAVLLASQRLMPWVTSVDRTRQKGGRKTKIISMGIPIQEMAHSRPVNPSEKLGSSIISVSFRQ